MGSLPEWVVVARREFTTRVRTVWFIVVTILGPIGMLGLILVPAYLAKKSVEEGITIEVIDRTTERVSDEMTMIEHPLFTIRLVDDDTPQDQMEKKILDKEIDGYLILPQGILGGVEPVYRGANTSNVPLMRRLEDWVTQAVVVTRAKQQGIDRDRVLALTASVDLDTQLTTGTGETREGKAAFLVGYATMFILYMAILLYAVNVMRSVVEEKTSRVVEIVVSTIRPRPLMLGKIIGVGSVGLLQLAIWMIVAFLIFQYRGVVLGWFGVSGVGVSFPTIGLDVVVITLLYFLLGFFFYASLYAAIGAMVNSEQEAQQLQMPVVMLLIIPVVCTQFVANDPLGGASRVLTMIPFASPVLMPMRYVLGGASIAEVAVSLGILAVSLAGAVWLAARIYRVGILMYGKRPSLREALRWIRR